MRRCWPRQPLAIAGCGSSGKPSSSSSSSSSAQAAGHQGGTFTILANSAFGVADPAQNYTLEEWQLLIDTHDGLTGFAKVGGVAGTKIVPDLATSIPTPTNGGKTYVFHIRRGSSSPTARCSSRATSSGRSSASSPCPGRRRSTPTSSARTSARPRAATLSQGVVADDSAYTLTINLTAPDPELMDQLALPFAYAVPGSTSLKLTGNNVPPGTGPYMWKSYNPNTQACWSATRTSRCGTRRPSPPGYPNEIIEKYGLQVSDEVTEVQNGQANEVFDGDQIPSDQLSQLNSAKYASQVHVNTLTADWYFALNTRRPPFNNLQARQAINYAANRTAYVKIAGGSSLAVPTCQILPPNFPVLRALLPVHRGLRPHHVDRARPGQGQAAGAAVGHGRDEGGRQRHQRPGRQGAGRADGLGPELDRLQGLGPAALAGIQYPFVQNSSNSGKWNVG